MRRRNIWRRTSAIQTLARNGLVGRTDQILGESSANKKLTTGSDDFRFGRGPEVTETESQKPTFHSPHPGSF
jgi:hypothetical protein